MLIHKQKIELYSFARKAHRLSRNLTLTTEDLTPINYVEEERKFYRSKTYNPQFIYRPQTVIEIHKPLLALEKKLSLLNIPEELRTYLEGYLNDLATRVSTKQSIGSIDFPEFADKLFNWDLLLLADIEAGLFSPQFKDVAHPRLYNAIEIRDIFQRYLKEIGISKIHVNTDSFNTHMIRVSDQRLTIGQDIKRNEQNVKRLLVHEIESHILQRHNIKTSKNPLYHMQKFSEWLLYSEGIAVFNEFKSGTITKSAFDSYILRYKAVLVRGKTFRQIYDILLRDTTEKKAYLTTYRIKRGMGDTALPGGYPKDALYLLGLYKINNYLKNGGELSLLYRCRIPALGELLKKYDLLSDEPFLMSNMDSNISIPDLLK